MRRVEAIAVAVMALCMSGCVIGNKPTTVSAAAPVTPKPAPAPAAPAPPPPPLSDYQTRVELPPPQPLTNEAVATTIPPEETPAKPVATNAKQAGKRGGSTVSSVRSNDPVGPVAPPAAAPPPPEAERPQIRDIVPASELKRLQLEATRMRQEIDQKLRPFGRRHLGAKEQELKDQASSLMKRSSDAEHQGDMRLAYEYALRGLGLAKALADGR